MEKDKILFLVTYLPSCAVYLKMLPASKHVKHKGNVWKWSTFESWLKSGFPSCSLHCVKIKLPLWDPVAYIHAYINLIIIIIIIIVIIICFVFFVVFNNPIQAAFVNCLYVARLTIVHSKTQIQFPSLLLLNITFYPPQGKGYQKRAQQIWRLIDCLNLCLSFLISA